MVARAMIFGHDAWYDEELGVWKYEDNDKIVDNNPRPCPQCGDMRTDEGYDPCVGHIPGAMSVCCGHGRKQGWIGWPEEEEEEEETYRDRIKRIIEEEKEVLDRLAND